MEGFEVYSIVTENGQVTVWNAETHSEVRRFKVQALAGYRVEAVDVSPDETRIVTGSHDKAICVWSLSTGERLLRPLQHHDTLTAVKYSCD